MPDFIFSNEFYKNIDLMIANYGSENCKPAHSYGPAVRSSWLIHHIESGKGTYYCRGKEFHLQAGDFFLMIPGERIFYQADENEPWTYSWVGLQGIKMEEYMKRTILPDQLVFSEPADGPVTRLFEVLKQIRYHPDGDLRLNAIGYQLMYELCQNFPAPDQKAAPSGSEFTEKILEYVEKNFDRPLSITSIASYFSLDRTYIHKLIKKALGMSLQEYILSLRLANACSYLIFTDLAVSDIARSVGYEDVLAFSRMFKKKKQISPSLYRQKKREEYAGDPVSASLAQKREDKGWTLQFRQQLMDAHAQQLEQNPKNAAQEEAEKSAAATPE